MRFPFPQLGQITESALSARLKLLEGRKTLEGSLRETSRGSWDYRKRSERAIEVAGKVARP